MSRLLSEEIHIEAGVPAGPYLFAKIVQLHLQGLQEAASLAELTLSTAQSLVALFDLRLHGV